MGSSHILNLGNVSTNLRLRPSCSIVSSHTLKGENDKKKGRVRMATEHEMMTIRKPALSSHTHDDIFTPLIQKDGASEWIPGGAYNEYFLLLVATTRTWYSKTCFCHQPLCYKAM